MIRTIFCRLNKYNNAKKSKKAIEIKLKTAEAVQKKT